MSDTAAGLLTVLALLVVLAVTHVPLGDYMARVYSSTKHGRAERALYRLCRIDPDADQSWPTYGLSVLGFSLASVLFLYGLQRVQQLLPLSVGFDPVESHLAWNTAASFVTNTNWQNYSGEATMGHLVQMAGLAVQNFSSAAVGMAVAVALVRGFARSRTNRVGNFWVDLTRGTFRILLPLSIVATVLLIAAGTMQTSPTRTRSARSPVPPSTSRAGRWPARRRSKSRQQRRRTAPTRTAPARSRTPTPSRTCSRSRCSC